MNWHTWKPVLALGAALAAGATASAADPGALRPDAGASGTTMTLGGRGTADQAATEDNEQTHGYRYRGYYGWGGPRWGGYYGGWGGGWNRGWGGWNGGFYPGYSAGFYRPSFYYSSFSAPAFYRPFPVYSSFYYGGCAPGFGFGIGISGDALSLSAPTVTLAPARPVPQPMIPPAANPMAPPAAPGDGTFRYDGGPSNPVPLPKADPQSSGVPGTDLPVSLKPKATPYKYKAYGEK